MKMADLLEKDKEKIIHDLAHAGTPQRAGSVLESALDRLLYTYNEQGAGEEERDAAAFMLGTARMAVPFVDSVGETRVWERTPEGAGPAKKKFPKIALILLIVGIVCAALSVLMLTDDRLSVLNFLGERTGYLIAAAGAVCLFLSGLFTGRPRKIPAKTEQQTELIVDSEKLYRSLRTVILAVDRNLEDVIGKERAAEKDRVLEQALLDKKETDLFSDLLEALYSEDGDMALSKLGNLKFYLHKKGIDVLDYSEENAQMFDLMPSPERATLRPALAVEGRVLKKGLATGGR